MTAFAIVKITIRLTIFSRGNFPAARIHNDISLSIARYSMTLATLAADALICDPIP
jgi:hypothetical protein